MRDAAGTVDLALAVAAASTAAVAVLLVPPRPRVGRSGGSPPGGGARGGEGSVGAVPTGRERGGARPVLGAVAVLTLATAGGVPGRVVVLGAALLAVLVAGGLLVSARHSARAAATRSERTREACEAIADDLAAGSSAERALTRASDDWPELAAVLAAHRVGADVPAAWRAVAAHRPGAEGLRLVAAAWQVSGRTGQGLAQALHRVAADLRATASTRRAVDSELASARATGRLVAGLPALAWLMGSGAGQHPVGWLLACPAGWVCLGLGLGLLLAGLGWVELIARGAVSP